MTRKNRPAATVAAGALALLALAGCPEPAKVCKPGTIREDLPKHPGVYYVCVDSGSGWTKVKSPATGRP